VSNPASISGTNRKKLANPAKWHWIPDRFVACNYGRGLSTRRASSLRVSGSTTSITGNANAQDVSHAFAQALIQPGAIPKAMMVEIPDTTAVMKNVRSNGSRMGAVDAGNFFMRTYFGARLARIRCSVRRCMFRRRAVSETLRLHSS
jgi:hypothetical protein